MTTSKFEDEMSGSHPAELPLPADLAEHHIVEVLRVFVGENEERLHVVLDDCFRDEAVAGRFLGHFVREVASTYSDEMAVMRAFRASLDGLH